MFTQSEISLRNSDSWLAELHSRRRSSRNIVGAGVEFQQLILLFIWDYYVIINWLIWYHKEEPSDLQIIAPSIDLHVINFRLQLEFILNFWCLSLAYMYVHK